MIAIDFFFFLNNGRFSLKYWTIKCNISGKIFRVVYNMYKSAKSCVAISGLLTDISSCLIEVRQGENMSPLLFSLYLNDLQQFLQEAHIGLNEISDLATHTFDNNLCALLNYIFYCMQMTLSYWANRQNIYKTRSI